MGRKRGRPWRLRAKIPIPPIDFKRYSAYSAPQLAVMLAGSSSLYLALFEPSQGAALKLSRRLAEQNRRRFAPGPRKTMWRGHWG